MSKTIIGLAGQKQSGKSTAGDYIASAVFNTVFQYSFADNLKKFCMDVLGLTHDQCYGIDDQKNTLTQYKWEDVDVFFRRKYAKTVDLDDLQGPTKELRTGYMTAREVMQVQGEMERKYFCKSLWVDAVFRQIKKITQGIHILVDCRHKNEIDKVIQEGGYVIHLAKITNNDNAASEAELLTIDWNEYRDRVFTIDNTYLTIEEKNAKIKEILQKIDGIVVV